MNNAPFFIYSRMLQLEEDSIRAMCQDIIAVKPDVVVTEKGISGKVERAQCPM